MSRCATTGLMQRNKLRLLFDHLVGASQKRRRDSEAETVRRSAHAGSRLKLIDAPGRSRLKCQPSSRTGENSPYGMIGGIEETSASFEARSAPRSYPTISECARKAGKEQEVKVPHGVRTSHPPRPRVMRGVPRGPT